MSASIVTRSTFTLADRLRIQQERARERDYIPIGRLTSVVFEAQRSTVGLSGSRPRYHMSEQASSTPEAMKPFSERQTVLWASITLDWLTHKNAPLLAISRDRKDLLLPNGLTPLPDIPDPRWVPHRATDIAPRIPQRLTGCPIVGDRVTDKITNREGRVYGVIHPVTELCVMLLGAAGTFGRITGHVDSADHTHLALLIDDSDPTHFEAYFVGGRFQFGS